MLWQACFLDDLVSVVRCGSFLKRRHTRTIFFLSYLVARVGRFGCFISDQNRPFHANIEALRRSARFNFQLLVFRLLQVTVIHSDSLACLAIINILCLLRRVISNELSSRDNSWVLHSRHVLFGPFPCLGFNRRLFLWPQLSVSFIVPCCRVASNSTHLTLDTWFVRYISLSFAMKTALIISLISIVIVAIWVFPIFIVWADVLHRQVLRWLHIIRIGSTRSLILVCHSDLSTLNAVITIDVIWVVLVVVQLDLRREILQQSSVGAYHFWIFLFLLDSFLFFGCYLQWTDFVIGCLVVMNGCKL